MKRCLFSGILLALIVLLAFSCNKNRFNFDHLESVEGAGEWKLPIGSAHFTLENVLSQLNDNDLVAYDEDGNLMLQYRFAMDPIIKGTDVMKYNDVSYSAHFEADNPYQYVLDNPIDTVVVKEMENFVKRYPEQCYTALKDEFPTKRSTKARQYIDERRRSCFGSLLDGYENPRIKHHRANKASTMLNGLRPQSHISVSLRH